MKGRRDVTVATGRVVRPSAVAATAVACAAMLSWGGAGRALASPEQEPVVGDASAIEAGVELRSGDASDYVALAAVAPVAVGDGVRTDATGYAEIAYIDGSRTRLDVDTEFEVVELVDDAGNSSTRTSMEVGRTWHRVESLGEGEEFTVETSQATATVRGTAFTIDCPTTVTCTYMVLSGIVELILADGSVIVLVGPAEVEVVGGIAGAVSPVTFDRVLGDPWLLDNIDRDTAAGFADLLTILRDSSAPDAGAVSPSPPPPTTTTSPTSTTEPSTPTLPTSPTSTTEPSTPALPPESTSSSTSSTSTTPTTTSTSSTTSTSLAPEGQPIALCHAVGGGGNTGNGYDYLEVSAEAAKAHAAHSGDLIPAPNRQCEVAVAMAVVAPTVQPPSTTTTTVPAPPAAAAAPVAELATAAPASTATAAEPAVTTAPRRAHRQNPSR
jgi:FecR protein